MSQFVSEIRETIVPGRGTRHGPLPPLLVSMTLVTGLVDAFSYLVLGHVFAGVSWSVSRQRVVRQ